MVDIINQIANEKIVLADLHFGFWWGLLFLMTGLGYFIHFRPSKKKMKIWQ